MIHSLFVLCKFGTVVLEKHNREVMDRSVLDPLLAELNSATLATDLKTIIAGTRCYLINVQREGLIYVAACPKESPPLLVIQLLKKVVSTFELYSGKAVTEKVARANTIMFFQILEEMIDSGFPLITEPNVLEMIVLRPTLLNKAISSVGKKTMVADKLPPGQFTVTPWRKATVKYSSNECFVDVVEEVNAIISKSGMPVTASVKGTMHCRSHLSGTPDCLISFHNGARGLDDVSFHPCVRINRWENERVLSFVPPDGRFELASYRVFNISNLPFSIRATVNYKQLGGGRVELDVSSKGLLVEGCVLSMEFPRSISNINATVTAGNWTFQEITKTLKWEIRKLPERETLTLRGNISLSVSDGAPDGTPPVVAQFTLPNTAASGLKIREMQIFNERYKAFKGAKYITKAGDYQVRT